jgi:hypothetical protein
MYTSLLTQSRQDSKLPGIFNRDTTETGLSEWQTGFVTSPETELKYGKVCDP